MVVHGRTLAEWFSWARELARRANPLEQGAQQIFEKVATASLISRLAEGT